MRTGILHSELEAKGLSLGIPRSASTSLIWLELPEKKTGLFLPITPAPGCAKTLSKWMALGTGCMLHAAGPWHGFPCRVERKPSEPLLGVGTPLSSQTKWSQFSGGQPGSTQLAQGVTQALSVLAAVTACCREGKWSGTSAPLSAGSHHQRWLWHSTLS